MCVLIKELRLACFLSFLTTTDHSQQFPTTPNYPIPSRTTSNHYLLYLPTSEHFRPFLNISDHFWPLSTTSDQSWQLPTTPNYPHITSDHVQHLSFITTRFWPFPTIFLPFGTRSGRMTKIKNKGSKFRIRTKMPYLLHFEGQSMHVWYQKKAFWKGFILI